MVTLCLKKKWLSVWNKKSDSLSQTKKMTLCLRQIDSLSNGYIFSNQTLSLFDWFLLSNYKYARFCRKRYLKSCWEKSYNVMAYYILDVGGVFLSETKKKVSFCPKQKSVFLSLKKVSFCPLHSVFLSLIHWQLSSLSMRNKIPQIKFHGLDSSVARKPKGRAWAA